MMRPMSILGAPPRCAARVSARAKAMLPPWLGRVATMWARTRPPVSARSPRMSAALWRTNSSGQRSSPPLARPRSSSTIALALDAPLIRPLAWSAATSLVNPKVRAGARERFEVGLDAAVQNRRLGARELDGEIVDLVRRHRGEQVFHGVDRGLTLADGGAPLDRLDLRQPRRDLRLPGEVDAAEHDPLPRGRRQEGRLGAGPGVEARARDGRLLPDAAPSAGTHRSAARALRGRLRCARAGTAPPGPAGTPDGCGPGSPTP